MTEEKNIVNLYYNCLFGYLDGFQPHQPPKPKVLFKDVFLCGTGEWKSEKFTMYMHTRKFYLQFNTFNSMRVNQKPFADFCDEILTPNMGSDLHELRNESDYDKFREVHDFIADCLTLLKADTIYSQVHDQADKIQSFMSHLNEFEPSIKEMVSEIETNLETKGKEQQKAFQGFASSQTERLYEQSQKSAESSVTILGIFVGVVMVFFGGFTILENTIGGMTTVTPYRLIFIMLLFGMVLFNVVVMLFYLVSKLTNKSIACQWCYYKKSTAEDSSITENSDTTENGDTTRCSSCTKRNVFRKGIWNKGLCRFVRKYPYIYWANASAVTMLVFDFLMYAFQLREPPIVGVTCPQVLFSALGALLIFIIFCLIAVVRDEKSPSSLLSYIKKHLKPKKDEEVFPVCAPAPVEENSNCNSNEEASLVYIPASMEENLKRDSDEEVSSECIPVPIKENSKRNLDEKTFEELNSEKEFAIRR